MEKIKKVIVGVSTYGPQKRVDGFIKAFWSNLGETRYDLAPVVCDDGTLDTQAVRERAQFCRSRNFQFIRNEQNIGIAGTWNNLCFSVPDADLAIIFNDDIRQLIPGWINRVVYFFDRNENVGMVGLPLVNEPGFDDQDERWRGQVGIVGAAVGCSFAVRPKDLFSIENPDKSKGFWLDTRAFHEEVHLGFRLAEKGLASFMLPWPPSYHMGGQTFSTNPELTFREPSPYLSMEDFLRYVRMSPWYVKELEEYYAQGKADKMSYSREMFSKYWGIHGEVDAGRRFQKVGQEENCDILAYPQKLVHERLVTPLRPRKRFWLNREGQEESCED